METGNERRRSDRLRRGVRAITALVLLGLITHSTYAGSGDEPHYLAIAHSAAFDLDLDLSNNYGAQEPLIAGGGLEPEHHVRPGAGGVIRPVHDVGMPLLFAPAVRLLAPAAAWAARTIPAGVQQRLRVNATVMYRHAMSAAMIALAALVAGLLFDLCVRLGTTPRAAFGTALLAMLSPPLMIQSVLFFTELPSALIALFVFGRVALADRPTVATATGSAPQPGTQPSEADWRTVRSVGEPAPSLQWLALGALTGLLFLVHARNAGLVAALTALAMAVARRQRWRAGAIAFLAGLAVLLAVRTAVNYHFWGTVLTTPHAVLGDAAATSATAREAGTRLAGLLIDQEFGLLIYAPIYALALAGLLAIPDRVVARRIAVVSGAYLLLILWPVTNVHGWTGGWSPPARFLTPIVPMLALGLPFALRRLPPPVAVGVVAVQILLNAYLWQTPKDLWNDGDGVAAVCARSGRTFCRYLPSLAPERTP